jgi:pyrroline-5-carboxylate reductase
MEKKMNDNKIIAIIGMGVMGEAIFLGLVNKQVIAVENIFAADPQKDRLRELEEKYHLKSKPDNATAVKDADVVILCVKPQKLTDVIQSLQRKIKPQALVLSIIAGATVDSLITGLGHPSVVRAMPNTPAQIGQGMTVWTQSQETSEQQHNLAKQILGALGKEIYVEEERYIDMATAVSGTGPAYVFLFLEAMIDSGVHLGLPRRIAEKMVLQTIKGSIDFYNQNHSHPARLRNQVTSPGGTSATAIYYLEKMGFRTAISRAIWAAFTRSQELGKGQKHQDPENI